jgi:hypothetical protein
MATILFLDESGSHNLTVIDPHYPVFVLGGVLIERQYAESVVEGKVRAFKRDVFGDENLILHTADMTRNRNGFERMQDASFRERCYERLNQLMRELDYPGDCLRYQKRRTPRPVRGVRARSLYVQPRNPG